MKSRKLNDIKNYCLVNGQLFTSNESRVIYSHSSNEVFDKCKFDSASLMSINDFLIIPITPRQTFVHNSVERETTILDGSCVYKNYSNENIIIKLSNFEYTNFLIKIFNLKSQSFEFEVNHLFSKCNFFNYWNNILQYVDENITINALHLPTETTLWQYSVADLGAEKVSKILGVFGETLVVVCKMPVYPEHILIGIDINDGKLLWSVNLPQYLMHSNLFYYEQNNSIISLRRNFLWEFSLSSMEILREKQLPETFKYNTLNVQVELASLYGDLIYFAGKDLENVRPSALVGVFDLKTEKLVDVHDLQSDGTFTVGGNSRPQVSGNKIYVQDTKNTLHILERESDALNEIG